MGKSARIVKELMSPPSSEEAKIIRRLHHERAQDGQEVQRQLQAVQRSILELKFPECNDHLVCLWVSRRGWLRERASIRIGGALVVMDRDREHRLRTVMLRIIVPGNGFRTGLRISVQEHADNLRLRLANYVEGWSKERLHASAEIAPTRRVTVGSAVGNFPKPFVPPRQPEDSWAFVLMSPGMAQVNRGVPAGHALDFPARWHLAE